MGVLFRYEIKKLLSRKLFWLLSAACLALLMIPCGDMLESAWSGRAQGMKDIYRLYEGQAVTEAFQKNVQKDFDQYVAVHADHFMASTVDDDEVTTIYFPERMDYYGGVWQAYQDIISGQSVEDMQNMVRYAADALARGATEDGSPLPFDTQQYYQEMTRTEFDAPSVHYAQGWNMLFWSPSPITGTVVLILIGIGVLPLFVGEGSARMESVLLCSAHRGKAIAAKLLSASLLACVVAILCYGMEFACIAITYGLDGATLSVSAVRGSYSGRGAMAISQAYALAALSTALAAVSVAALVALASALFRHPLPVLLLAAAAIAIQIVLYDSRSDWWSPDSALLYQLQRYLGLLPAVALVHHDYLISSMSSLDTALFALGLPALLAALLLWLAPRCYFWRRKA